MKWIFLLLTCTLYSQNIVIHNGDATEAFNSVPSDHTIIYGCDRDSLVYLHFNGDYTLPGNIYIGSAVVTIYGELDYNGFEVIYLCEDSELIVTGETLTIPENDTENLRLYPNPTTGIFYVSTKRGYTIDIYNISGQLVAKTPDLRGLPSGMYIALVTIGPITEQFKIIKK